MKIIAFYLPQFHTFPENDKWWGKGFTEWTNTKKARKLFKEHYQPREPWNDFYYNLLDKKTFEWQIKLAKENGVDGFCIYHYWFGEGKKLMEKPLELFLENKDLKQEFCICWANENWTRSWDGGNKEIIMPQDYGDKKNWEKHFNYLLNFFKDERYIKKDGKPILVIYRPALIPVLKEMLECWNILAKNNDIPGICYIAQNSETYYEMDFENSMFDYGIMYEPGYTQRLYSLKHGLSYSIKKLISNPKLFLHSNFQIVKVKIFNSLNLKNNNLTICKLNYDLYWKDIIERRNGKYILGAFVDWDNSARRGEKGARIFIGSTPQKFENYFTQLLIKGIKQKQEFIFITAWNEWAEGAYLEPDKKYNTQYLKAIKNSLKKVKFSENKR